MNRVARLLAALAMLSLVPAYLYIEAHLVSAKTRPLLPEQDRRFAESVTGLSQHPITCSSRADSAASITKSETRRLLDLAFFPTFAVNDPFHGETLVWSFKKGLPYTPGLYGLFKVSIAAQAKLAHVTRWLDLCRRVPDDDEDEARNEEKRSQAWLDEQRQELEKIDQELATARKAYEEDHPKLAAVAWTLGILQVVGWSLLYFVVLPQDVRAWRQRRATKKSGPT